MTSPKTWSNLVHGLELAFPDIPVANIARRFGVTVDAVNRNRAHYDNRLRTQQGCAVFNSAPDFKTFIADPHNFRLLTGELCLGAYIHNTLRHAEARALHATIDVVPGITHAADAAHRHHLEHDPRSIVAGSDRTVEGALLRKIRRFQVDVAPPSEKASLAAKAEPKFFDLVAPSIDEADRAVDRIDIENPDPLQRMVGDVAASAPCWRRALFILRLALRSPEAAAPR